jgi:hypothetical protein
MISPLNVIPAILLLFADHPFRKAPLFLLGFIVGVGVILGGFVVIASSIDGSWGSGSSPWGALVRAALGLYLVVAGIKKLRTRATAGGAGLPKWMDGLISASPAKAAGFGVVLGAANPKNLAVAVAASLTVASASLSVAHQIIVVVIYSLVASLGVAAPIVTMVVLGERSASVLRTWRTWLEQNNSTVMAVLFFIFGIVLVSQALGTTSPSP